VPVYQKSVLKFCNSQFKFGSCYTCGPRKLVSNSIKFKRRASNAYHMCLQLHRPKSHQQVLRMLLNVVSLLCCGMEGLQPAQDLTGRLGIGGELTAIIHKFAQGQLLDLLFLGSCKKDRLAHNANLEMPDTPLGDEVRDWRRLLTHDCGFKSTRGELFNRSAESRPFC